MLIEIFSKYTPREYGFASVLMKKKKSSISRRLPVNRLGTYNDKYNYMNIRIMMLVAYLSGETYYNRVT